jgi:hypothetical protein
MKCLVLNSGFAGVRQVQAGLRKSLPRLGRAAAFLGLAIPVSHGGCLCRGG